MGNRVRTSIAIIEDPRDGGPADGGEGTISYVNMIKVNL